MSVQSRQRTISDRQPSINEQSSMAKQRLLTKYFRPIAHGQNIIGLHLHIYFFKPGRPLRKNLAGVSFQLEPALILQTLQLILFSRTLLALNSEIKVLTDPYLPDNDPDYNFRDNNPEEPSLI